MTFTNRVVDSAPDSIELEISGPHLNPEAIRRNGAALDVLVPKLRWEAIIDPFFDPSGFRVGLRRI